MRSRILAVIILVLFLVLPAIAYWYFFHAAKSTLTFTTFGDVGFHVTLEGKLHYDYLPLADAVLRFSEDCRKTCTLVIPPVQYGVILTSSGHENINDVLSLKFQEHRVYTVDFKPEFTYQKIETVHGDDGIGTSLVENARKNMNGNFSPIGSIAIDKYLVLRTEDRINEVGVLTANTFHPLVSLPYPPEKVSLDISRRYIIVQKSLTEQNILSLEGKGLFVFPISEPIVLIDKGINWKVKTQDNVYEFENGKWKKNPRFSDFIDVSPTIRIGYIDAHDSDKLSLQNLPLGTSVIQLIERDTGKSSVIKKGINVLGFFHMEDKMSFFDTEKNINVLTNYTNRVGL